MADKRTKKDEKIVDFEEVRQRRVNPTATLLKDTIKIAEAISERTCVICNEQKSCVNKTGVCVACFESVLTDEEKKLAVEEARHKIISIDVKDDRW